MSKKQEEKFRQSSDQLLRLALNIAAKKEARGIPPPPLEQAMNHIIVALRSTTLALSEIFKSSPGRMSAQ